jgi:phage N-6-adenine-methyltransferase
MSVVAAAVVSAELEAIRRSTDLHALEQIIRRGKVVVLEVAEAVHRVHEAQLWKLTHSTWESWCNSMGISARRTYQLIEYVKVVNQIHGPVPTERVARELVRVPAEERAEVLAEATEAAGGEASASAVRDVVERRADGKAKSPRLQTRRTPRWVFDALVKRFGPFALDAYAEPHNALCPRFYTREQDGNIQPWEDQTFANPEFADMGAPLLKAVEEAKRGVRSLILGPVGCSQDWYHELAIQGTIYTPDCRITYDTPDGKPTGVRACHNGLSVEDCAAACRCVNGADRDTIVLGFGGEHRNQERAVKAGRFRVERLSLKELRP